MTTLTTILNQDDHVRLVLYDAERRELDAQMRDVLIHLAVCSQAPAAAWDVRSAGSDESLGGSRPPGDIDVLNWPRRYGACRHNDSRRRVIAEAEAELVRTRRRTVTIVFVEETLAELKARIVAVGQGWPAKEVANRLRVSVRLVYEARVKAGRDRELGYELPAQQGRQRGTAGKFEPQPDAAARDNRIRAHRAQQKTVRAIAMIEGVSIDTVKRALGQRS